MSYAGYLTARLRDKAYRLRRYAAIREYSTHKRHPNMLVNVTHILAEDRRVNLIELCRDCPSLVRLDAPRNFFQGIDEVILVHLPSSLQLNSTCRTYSIEHFRPWRSIFSMGPWVVPRGIRFVTYTFMPSSTRAIQMVMTDKLIVDAITTGRHTVDPSELVDYINKPIEGIVLNRNTITTLTTCYLTKEWIQTINSLANLSDLSVATSPESYAPYSVSTDVLYSISVPLKSLCCSVDQDVHLSRLPRSLKYLRLNTSRPLLTLFSEETSALEELHIDLLVVGRLPSALLSLTIGYVDAQLIFDCKYLVSLVYRLNRLHRCEPSEQLQFPDSLTHLAIHNYADTDSDCIPHMPERLPRRLRVLRSTLSTQTEETMKWSLAGLREVEVIHKLTDKQLRSFTGSMLNVGGEILVSAE